MKNEIDSKKELVGMFNILIDEILHNQYRAKTMLSSDLDLATHNFYNGQVIVLQRILDSIDDDGFKLHKYINK